MLAFGASDIVSLITGLAWPVLIALIFLLLLPVIRRTISSRGFTIKVGGMEITVQKASEQLSTGLEIDALQRKGVRVESVRSTADAVRVLDRGDRFDVIITDMGRTAEGRNAGLNLIRELKAQGVTQPIIVYASASAVARTRDEALRLGAYAATASATELMALLTTLGLA